MTTDFCVSRCWVRKVLTRKVGKILELLETLDLNQPDLSIQSYVYYALHLRWDVEVSGPLSSLFVELRTFLVGPDTD